jgi:adenylate cyclase
MSYGWFIGMPKPKPPAALEGTAAQDLLNYGRFIGPPKPEPLPEVIPVGTVSVQGARTPAQAAKAMPKPAALPKAAPEPPVAPTAAPAPKAAPRIRPLSKPRAKPAPAAPEAAVGIKVKFPIGVKLVTIITILLLVSLGVITALVSVLISSDVRITAEDNNFSINRRAGSEAETVLTTTHSKLLVLLHNLTLLNTLPAVQEQEQAHQAAYFFQQNPDIVAIATSEQPSVRANALTPLFLTNTAFFLANDLDPGLLASYLAAQEEALNRVQAGEILLRNATPALGFPMMALFCPWQTGETLQGAAIFFSSENLIDTFGTGANVSFMINDVGDVLVHPDSTMVRSGVNLGNLAFVQNVLESTGQSLQTRYTDEAGVEYFGAFQRLSLGNTAVITIIRSSLVFEGIVAATWRNIFLTIGVLGFSVVFILIFSRTISRPLTELTQAAGQIEDGNYHLNLRNKNRDETGVLTQSFISMSHGLENFEKFTNKTLARLARKGQLVTGGTDRKATIFFSDIRSFTAISEKLQPAEVIAFINEYMERMVKCVLITGGTIDKFIGDAVMAHWGAVESTGSPEQDALNCVKAALMMRASLRSFNQDRGGDQKPIIKIGCGINSGTVVAGQIGSAERMEYTIIGDAVSFADRTETFNKPFGTEILMTEDTWKLCGQYLLTEEMPSVVEHGKTKRMFAVVNIRDPEEVTGTLRDLEQIPKTAPLINRQCVGPAGPQSLAAVRELLGIPTPDLSKVDTSEEEKKYKIQG